MDAIDYAMPSTMKYGMEYGGWVYQNFNGTYSADINRGFQTSVDIGGGPIIKTATGVWHTHPPLFATHDTENFSGSDMRASVDERIPGYLGTPGGKRLKFIPGRGAGVLSLSRSSCSCR